MRRGPLRVAVGALALFLGVLAGILAGDLLRGHADAPQVAEEGR